MKKVLTTFLLFSIILLIGCNKNNISGHNLLELSGDNGYYIEYKYYDKDNATPQIISYKLYLILKDNLTIDFFNTEAIESYYLEQEIYYTSDLLPNTYVKEFYHNGNYLYINNDDITSNEVLKETNLTSLKMRTEVSLHMVPIFYSIENINNNKVNYNITTNYNITNIDFISHDDRYLKNDLGLKFNYLEYRLNYSKINDELYFINQLTYTAHSDNNSFFINMNRFDGTPKIFNTINNYINS